MRIRSLAVYGLVLLLAAANVSCKPLCPINSCQTRMVHLHGGEEFRGMPWYKKQRPRIGEKLKKPSKEMEKELNKKGGGGKSKN